MLLGCVDTAVPGVERTPSPSRISRVQNMETSPGSGPCKDGGPVSRSQVGPNSLAGQDAQEANAGGRKAAGKRGTWLLPPLAASYNWPDTRPAVLGRESVLTCGR